MALFFYRGSYTFSFADKESCPVAELPNWGGFIRIPYKIIGNSHIGLLYPGVKMKKHGSAFRDLPGT
jgi:hypothetical protein